VADPDDDITKHIVSTYETIEVEIQAKAVGATFEPLMSVDEALKGLDRVLLYCEQQPSDEADKLRQPYVIQRAMLRHKMECNRNKRQQRLDGWFV
jgi:hypothetical protein